MRVSASWLRDYVELPADVTAEHLGARLISLGFELEGLHRAGGDVSGPLVVGQVLQIEELTEFKKPIRYCQVDIGEPAPRGIVCGAVNFAVGDHVVVCLPGAVLPGGFEISARKTYGHVSDGMICSARELALGDEYGAIMVLPPSSKVGADAIDVLGLRDDILDLDVTPDRGYADSMRGMAREASHAFDVEFRDPAGVSAPTPDESGWPASIQDVSGCDLLSLLTVTGLDSSTSSPPWLTGRLVHAGMRPISLAVDVTNYVMLETGQPMHAYDRALLTGDIVIRRARAGERLTMLDGVDRPLDPDDMVVTDASGPIGLAGVMGGASTEISGSTVDIVLEAAHWDPSSVSRSVRRHRLPSEAARRFERGVDPLVAGPALARAAGLLAELGAANPNAGYTVVGEPAEIAPIRMAIDLPARIVGVDYTEDAVLGRLEQIGCAVRIDGREGDVTPPSWRPDLLAPADLVEEVARLEGYDRIPAALPVVPPGRGLSISQRRRQTLARSLADDGLVEVLCYPFVGADTVERMGYAAGDPEAQSIRLANPLASTEPLLRTTLLPGLFGALRRNVGRGLRDVALFQIECVYRRTAGLPPAPVVPVGRAPDAAELAALNAALPAQPWHVAAVLAGDREPRGWWGPGRRADWSDTVAVAHVVAGAMGARLSPRAAEHGPWHPGRCAALLLGDVVVGHAGELHPRVTAEFDLPARTCAVELDLDAIGYADVPVQASVIASYPPVLLDVSLAVPDNVPAAAVQDAVRAGAGPLLESIALFDVYAGDRLAAGQRSLAYTLRFRASDRTLTIEEATAARDAAVARASRDTGAVLRS
ncbi:MAG: phenylalanine--tRNA ligase subunit beta [Mycobacteriales bacterium]|nr:MAG: phenylalanine--tRNA ligase subunit beta [Pseudonocardiales bacterium]